MIPPAANLRSQLDSYLLDLTVLDSLTPHYYQSLSHLPSNPPPPPIFLTSYRNTTILSDQHQPMHSPSLASGLWCVLCPTPLVHVRQHMSMAKNHSNKTPAWLETDIQKYLWGLT